MVAVKKAVIANEEAAGAKMEKWMIALEKAAKQRERKRKNR